MSIFMAIGVLAGRSRFLPFAAEWELYGLRIVFSGLKFVQAGLGGIR